MRTGPALGAALLLGAGVAQAADIPLEAFARQPEFNDVVISPDGRHVAVSVPDGNQTNLAVIRLADKKVTAAIQSGRDTHVADIYWANDQRVIIAMADSAGPLDQPSFTGEFNAVDADGRHMSYLFGWRPRRSMAEFAAQEATVGFGTFVSDLKDDPDHVMIASVHPREAWTQTGRSTLYKVNVETSATRVVARAPITGWSGFVVDDQGKLHFTIGSDEQTLATRTFRFLPGSDEWKEVGSGKLGAEIVPLRITADGSRIYVRARNDQGRLCLATLDPDSGATRMVNCHNEVDVGLVVFSTDGNTPLAAYYHPGRIEASWITPEHPEAVALRRFAASFPGQIARPTSRTRDGSLMTILVYSDRNPGDFYLYDTKEGKAEYLFSVRSWIDPEQMAERRPIRYETRDGATIHGYLTLPRGVAAEQLPLIVHPHGGPFGVRDAWGWTADPQAMASRGYAVLQVNFRGSGGYGHQHHEAARGQWGGMMIDDITDGVRWAIEQRIADPERICIYGGSYGGYASLMSAVREPDLYKCTVGYVGVYDIPLWMRDTDVSDRESGRNYMRQYVGNDPEELRRQSPIHHLDRLKAAVFLVHGKHDIRVPYNQATQLRKALKARDYPFEWRVEADEGHGFYRLDARVGLYEQLFAFFDKHIGAAD
ncbi:alpha/beta hydrolase family protein [Sinimarinibacterium flocculans]|uniref:Dipeptidyl aminopeptidase/acylaminoacyl peptidase n=1 Tax=Sinimarinibacterium flocculans TaxID=985250 RepID=A0A318EGH4_9GAMM|nr:S9 family peptidase [Sinimarinibacterium flocculans]PXV69648.1 dipeptidyl aminopeptidase/acylaminoacyl peptidase [Sinimarinibacterium flocculans]